MPCFQSMLSPHPTSAASTDRMALVRIGCVLCARVHVRVWAYLYSHVRMFVLACVCVHVCEYALVFFALKFC
jgi:predicted naringenin-chalcone synthase